MKHMTTIFGLFFSLSAVAAPHTVTIDSVNDLKSGQIEATWFSAGENDPVLIENWTGIPMQIVVSVAKQDFKTGKPYNTAMIKSNYNIYEVAPGTTWVYKTFTYGYEFVSLSGIGNNGDASETGGRYSVSLSP